MANIEKRDSSYRVKIRLKGHPLQTATFARLTDAKRWAQQTESAMREGRHFKTAESKRHSLEKAIERYLKNELTKKPKSYYAQSRQLAWWQEKLGCYRLSDITPAFLAEQRDALLNEQTVRGSARAPATVNRYMAVLSHLFTVAVKEWGWLEHNPMLKVSKLKEPRGRVRFLSDEERARLLLACDKSTNSYLYTVVVLCLSTGARKMEIMSLTWDQVDFHRNMITLHETKNGERRVLPLVGKAREQLLSHRKIHYLGSNLIFPSKHNRDNPMDLRTPWEAVLKEAEISEFRFHDLRHSAASYLAMNGATLAEIAEVLGHKTLQMVKRYAHLSEAHTAKVVASMNEKIFG